jgi:hypothetical protein
VSELWIEQLHAWHEFYLLIGTAAATLTALMFVVISLGTRVVARDTGVQAVRTFVTPTVVFFTTALLLSAIMLMPSPPTVVLGGVLAVGGVAGIAYLVVIGVQEQWRRSSLGREDWAWYYALPLGANLLLLVAALGVEVENSVGLYAAAVVGMLFVVVGIRNAWDLALYLAHENETGAAAQQRDDA